MRNRKYNLDRSKSLVSQIESIFFNISRVKKINISEEFWAIIQKTDSLRSQYNPNNNRYMNVPLSISDSQEEDIVIEK